MGTCTLSHKIIYFQNPFRKLLGLKKKFQNVTHKVEQQSNGQFTRGKHIHGIKCQGKCRKQVGNSTIQTSNSNFGIRLKIVATIKLVNNSLKQ
jgi:hypothetical protein